jgi:A/G-specific adenine glycosylase
MDPAALRALAAWYRPRRGAYPWRAERPDPYHVLVSEVMLQQTQAARVAPAYRRFLAQFPTVGDLAAAPVAEVLEAWAGLGYNRRAVALSNAARAIVASHGGRVPSDPEALRRLPGVGPYTAAAVAAFGFGLPAPPVDTNVRRVLARAVLGREPAGCSPAAARAAADASIDRADPGGWSSAVMDLGREVCRPLPRCDRCPIARWCRWRASNPGRPERAPGASGRRQGPFDGSFRQLRGRVVAALRERPSASVDDLAAITGQDPDRVRSAVWALAADGVVEAGPEARGPVRLPR